MAISYPTQKNQVRWRDYADASGNSGVTHYAILNEAIAVMFRGGRAYLYTGDSPGRKEVEEMQQRAQAGRGLSGYIATLKTYAYELD